MTHVANLNENMTQPQRIWYIRDLVEPIIGRWQKKYKNSRHNGNSLVYHGVVLTEKQIDRINKLVLPYQSKAGLHKANNQILKIRIFEQAV